MYVEARFCHFTACLFSCLHTLVDDGIFLRYPGDVGIRGGAEVAGRLEDEHRAHVRLQQHPR